MIIRVLVKRMLDTISFLSNLRIIYGLRFLLSYVFWMSLYLCILCFFYHEPLNFGYQILSRGESVIAKIFKAQIRYSG